jgi:hypothetical protein
MKPLWSNAAPGAPAIISATYKIKATTPGAFGDGSAYDDAAFLRQFGRCNRKGHSVEIEEAPGGYWRVSQDVLAALGRADGVVVVWDGTVVTDRGWTMPHEHRWYGRTRRTNGLLDQGSGSLRASAAFPNDGTPLVRMGGTSNAMVHGIRIEDMHLSGAGLTFLRAIYADGLQEGSGLVRVVCQGFNEGVYFGYGTQGAVAARNANFENGDLELYLNPNATGYGLYCWGSNVRFSAVTASAWGTLAGFASVAVRLDGLDNWIGKAHGEYCLAGVQLGGDVLDIAGAVVPGLSTDGCAIDQVNVTHPATHDGSPVDPCPRVAWIRDSANNRVQSYTLGHVRAKNNCANLIEDAGSATYGVPALTLSAATYPYVRVFGRERTASGAAYASRYFTSAHHGTRALAMAGDLAEFDPTFADIIRVTGLGGASRTLHSLLGGYPGRRVLVEHQENVAHTLTLPNNSGTGTAGARFRRPAAGGNVVLSYGDVAECVYGLGHGSAGGWFTRLLT